MPLWKWTMDRAEIVTISPTMVGEISTVTWKWTMDRAEIVTGDRKSLRANWREAEMDDGTCGDCYAIFQILKDVPRVVVKMALTVNWRIFRV